MSARLPRRCDCAGLISSSYRRFIVSAPLPECSRRPAVRRDEPRQFRLADGSGEKVDSVVPYDPCQKPILQYRVVNHGDSRRQSVAKLVPDRLAPLGGRNPRQLLEGCGIVPAPQTSTQLLADLLRERFQRYHFREEVPGLFVVGDPQGGILLNCCLLLEGRIPFRQKVRLRQVLHGPSRKCARPRARYD